MNQNYKDMFKSTYILFTSANYYHSVFKKISDIQNLILGLSSFSVYDHMGPG